MMWRREPISSSRTDLNQRRDLPTSGMLPFTPTNVDYGKARCYSALMTYVSRSPISISSILSLSSHPSEVSHSTGPSYKCPPWFYICRRPFGPPRQYPRRNRALSRCDGPLMCFMSVFRCCRLVREETKAGGRGGVKEGGGRKRDRIKVTEQKKKKKKKKKKKEGK